MPEREFPTHDILPTPEGLDEKTLQYVLERLAYVAMDYGFPEAKHQIDVTDTASVDEFITQLEEHIQLSTRDGTEKELSLQLLNDLINSLKSDLEQTQRVD